MSSCNKNPIESPGETQRRWLKNKRYIINGNYALLDMLVDELVTAKMQIESLQNAGNEYLRSRIFEGNK